MKGAAAGVLALGSHRSQTWGGVRENAHLLLELPVQFGPTFHELALTTTGYVSAFAPECAF